MADISSIGGLLGSFAGMATSNSASGWIGLGISMIVSTIVGGIVLLVVMEILSKGWGESISAGRVFTFMLIINVINTFAIGYILPFFSFIPYVSYYVVSLLIWIALMKLFFSGMKMMHAAITGIIGFALSMVLLPALVGIVMGMLPI